MRRFALTVFALVLGALPARAAVEIQTLESPAGQPFWLVSAPEIPIVAAEISFAGGARLDPEGRSGLATMMAELLSEGAGERDAVAFAEERERLSARFGFGAERDALTASARMLVENAAESAALFATALASPRFDEEPMARIRGQRLASLAEEEEEPLSVAAKAWYARSFPDHPYGRPAGGLRQDVAEITREDLVSQHRRLVTRAAARIGIVGAVSAEEAGRLVDIMVSGLPEGEPVTAARSAATPPPGVEVIPMEVPQSAAVFGQPGIARDDPDFFAAFVMNYVLGGGGFASRLMEEVREKRGLAYSVYSYLNDLDEAALHLGAVQTANERMAESLEVIRAEWARMADEGVSAEDLEKAKRYLTGAFPLQFDSNAKIASYLVFMQAEGLPPSYLAERNAKIEAVTREDVARVAERLLRPDALSITVVGQPAGL